MSTYSSYIAGGVGLSNFSTQNPVTVTSGGTLVATGTNGVALFGGGSYDWTIANQGTIKATGSFGAGVYLHSAGSITNQNGGAITGNTVNGLGIFLSGGGYVTNQAGGSIGGELGIYGRNAAATIVNNGVVTGNTAAGAAIEIVKGATVTNQSSGVISGFIGISLPQGAGSIVNAGTIAGNAASAPGIVLDAGGYVSNQPSGVIRGIDGVFATTLAATATNAGSIAGGYAGVLFRAGGYVGNAATTVVSGGTTTTIGGSITGAAFGVLISGGVGTVTNAGAMFNTAGYGGTAVGTIQLSGVALSSGGSVSNATSGTIGGDFFGVRIAGATGTVVNDGSIFETGNAGNNAAGDVAGVALLAGGTLVNDPTGHINATWKGVEIGQVGTPASGMLLNRGSIYASNAAGNAGAAVWINGPGVISNASGGTIAGGPFGIVAYLPQDTVLNAGVIKSPSYKAIDLTGGGSVTNAANATISGAMFGIQMSGSAGAVLNNGTIFSTALFNGAGFDAAAIAEIAGGTVVNNGSVQATWIGVQIGQTSSSAGGTLFNSGHIYAYGHTGTIVTGAATWIHGPGLISNAAGGTIAGGPFGIVAYDQITVINAGAIGGTGFALDATAGFTDRVVVDPGAVFSGKVSGGNTVGSTLASSTLELAAGASAGTLHGLGSQYVDFAHVTIDSGAAWTLASAALAAGYTVTDSGTLTNTGSLGSPVTLTAGAVLSNASGGIIAGAGGGAAVTATGSATVVNAGTIGSATAASPFGIYLPGGGTVSNASGGVIQAGSIGVRLNGASAAVANAGSIVAGNDGVYLNASTWTLTNSGTVRSTTLDNGAYVRGGAGSIGNSGTFSGHYAGLWLTAVSAANIGNTGTLIGGYDGLFVGDGNAVVTNQGLIASTTLDNGVYVKGGSATITNSGTISGAYDGLYFRNAAGTITNFGSIAGTHDALQFANGFTNRLIVAPGAAFSGTIDGGNTLGGTATSTLELASGASIGTLHGLGGGYVNFAGITIDNSAQWTLGGSNTLVAGQVLTNAGTLTVPAGSLTDTGLVTNNGLVIADPGLVDLAGTINGAGTLVIDTGTTLELDQTVGSGQTIAFADATGTLVLGDIGGFQATIGSFTQGDEIFLAGTTIASDSFVNNTLTLFASGGGTLGTVAFAPGAATAGELFVNAQGGVGGAAPCFAAGTRIATDHGDVAVEHLRVGDVVRTVLRGAAPVVWIGRREVDCARHAHPLQVWPVRVKAGAFGPGQPQRDLLLSPDHAVYVNGVLVPVKHLINGSSIAQERVAAVTYYHLELPEHDVLLAEGLPAESFLDMKDGSNYARSGGAVRLHPEWPARLWEAVGCAPLVVAGPELAAARAVVERFATLRHAA